MQPNAVVATEVGQQAILHCNATGTDPPTIIWRSSEGVDVGNTNNSRMASHANGSLVIYNTEISDTGRYTCIATNRAGSINFTTMLNVTGELQYDYSS